MTTAVYQYRFNCVDEATDVTVWGTTAPTTCPNNTAHTIDPTSITIVSQVDTQQVIVKEEAVPTGGNFQATTLKLIANANTISTIPAHWPFNITAFGVNFVTTELHHGDIMSMYAGKDTTVGVILSAVSPASPWVSGNYVSGNYVSYNHPKFGERVYTCILNTVSNEDPTNKTYWHHGYAVTVSPTVITYTQVGYYIKLVAGATSEELGRVLYIDSNNNKIYLEKNSTNTFSPASPTYVQQTAYLIKDYEIGYDWCRNIGEMKIGGSHIPADTYIEVSYQNKSPTVVKELIGHVEYLY